MSIHMGEVVQRLRAAAQVFEDADRHALRTRYVSRLPLDECRVSLDKACERYRVGAAIVSGVLADINTTTGVTATDNNATGASK